MRKEKKSKANLNGPVPLRKWTQNEEETLAIAYISSTEVPKDRKLKNRINFGEMSKKISTW